MLHPHKPYFLQSDLNTRKVSTNFSKWKHIITLFNMELMFQ